MTSLVSKEDAKNHLRIDGDADDGWLDLWIPAVSDAVLAWLKNPERAYVTVMDGNGDTAVDTDSNGDPVVKPRVKAAALVELAQQYRFRDGADAAAVPAQVGHGYMLGMGATALLSSLRKSTVA